MHSLNTVLYHDQELAWYQAKWQAVQPGGSGSNILKLPGATEWNEENFADVSFPSKYSFQIHFSWTQRTCRLMLSFLLFQPAPPAEALASHKSELVPVLNSVNVQLACQPVLIRFTLGEPHIGLMTDNRIFKNSLKVILNKEEQWAACSNHLVNAWLSQVKSSNKAYHQVRAVAPSGNNVQLAQPRSATRWAKSAETAWRFDAFLLPVRFPAASYLPKNERSVSVPFLHGTTNVCSTISWRVPTMMPKVVPNNKVYLNLGKECYSSHERINGWPEGPNQGIEHIEASTRLSAGCIRLFHSGETQSKCRIE